jgi:hypothetical protein
MKKTANLILLTFLTFLTAFGQNVDLEWVKSIGGTDDDRGNSMTIDSQGNTYTTGNFQGTVDFDPGVGEFILTSKGENDIYVQKMDAGGEFVWAISMGSDAYLERGESISIDIEGNIYVTGSFEGTVDFDPGVNIVNLISNGGSDFFIQKLDSAGNLLWAKNIGGTNYEYSNFIITDNQGNVYTTGSINSSNIDFDPGVGTYYLSEEEGVIFVLKLDSSGNFLWAKNMGGFGSSVFTCGKGICIDNQKNVYLTGVFGGIADFDPGIGICKLISNGNNDLFTMKLDASGNFIWAESIGSTGDDKGYSIKIDLFDNLYLTGIYTYTVDFDPGPYSFELTCEGTCDIFVLKLDGQGNFIWVKGMGGWDYDVASSLAIDNDNYIYITGGFKNTVDFNPGTEVFNLTSFGSTDVFLEKLDADGNFVWVIQMGGPTSSAFGHSLAINNYGSVYIAGTYYGTVDFDPGETTNTQTGNGSGEIFVTKLIDETVGVSQIEKANTLIYPNPSNGTLYLKNYEKLSSIIVHDIMANKIIEQKITSECLDLTSLPSGMYFLTLTTVNNVKSVEIVIIN